MFKRMSLVLAMLWPAAAAAQATPAPTSGQKLSVEFRIAPNMAMSKPYGPADYTDDTRMSLSIKGTQPLTGLLEASLSVGPSITFDDDKDPPHGSAFGGTLEIATRTLKPWTAYASYGAEASFEEHFHDEAGHKSTMKGGARYGRDDLMFSTGFKADLFYQRVDASAAGGDQHGPGAEATLTNKFLWFAHLAVKGGIQRNIYQDRDPVTAGKRRDWQYFGLAGFDFAPALHALLKGPAPRLKDHLRELTLGYKYAKLNSNIDTNDKTSHAFVPAITVKLY